MERRLQNYKFHQNRTSCPAGQSKFGEKSKGRYFGIIISEEKKKKKFRSNLQLSISLRDGPKYHFSTFWANFDRFVGVE